VVPYHRLQTVTRSRTVFQRRRNLAHLVADTASGGVLNRVHPIAYDQPEERMRTLQHRLRERLQTSLRE
jgi:putative membrane protein